MSETDLPDLTDGEAVERIDKADLKPLYDTNHVHIFEKDLDDENDFYFAEMCIKSNCNVGRLVAKN